MRLDWTDGNRIELLENGEEYYPRVFAAIAAATEEVLLETFILFDDKVGRGLQQALLQAAANGAKVHVLIDGWGSPDLTDDFIVPLLEAGVQLRAFDPVKRLFGMRLNLFRRMHRKLVVVDGRLAYIGGINYSLDHLGEFGPEAKQDYAAEIEGPLVARLHAFCAAGVRQTLRPHRSVLQRWRDRRRGAKTAEAEADAAAAHPPGSARAAFVHRDNGMHRTDIERQYRAALRRARRRVVIANAYFFPGYRFLKDLRRAARRGVEVHLVLQGQPDMLIAQMAASTLYGHLIRSGIHVHEYCRRPLHGKVATIDDEWATIGSSNLDPLSLGLNLEANVVILDPAFATTLRERLDVLIRQDCRRVELPPARLLSSAWAQVRGFVVYHVVRHFPDWLLMLPEPKQKIATLQAAQR